MGGCLMRIVSGTATAIAVLAVLLWLLNSPESVANLIGLGFGLAARIADAFGLFMNQMVAEIDGFI